MSDEQLPPEADVRNVSTKLNEGIETCRCVLTNYRTLLTGAHAEVPINDNEPAEPGRTIDRG